MKATKSAVEYTLTLTLSRAEAEALYRIAGFNRTIGRAIQDKHGIGGATETLGELFYALRDVGV